MSGHSDILQILLILFGILVKPLCPADIFSLGHLGQTKPLFLSLSSDKRNHFRFLLFSEIGCFKFTLGARLR